MGGEIEELKSNLKESFLKIKEDIAILNQEIYNLKRDYEKVLEQNISLRNGLKLDKETVRNIVRETVNDLTKKSDFNERLIRKIKRNKRIIIKNRILELADEKKYSLPEMKDVIVDHEKLCSKATFYRYADKLTQENMLSILRIQEKEIVAKIYSSSNPNSI
ncbi:hypothetical protein JW930_05090 [Candidatus Woesearchaeota archaeon]|nr:hypothetical protein [Candidatus Woesearchaeota archaeon]